MYKLTVASLFQSLRQIELYPSASELVDIFNHLASGQKVEYKGYILKTSKEGTHFRVEKKV